MQWVQAEQAFAQTKPFMRFYDLSSNPLENGDTPPPTLLDEDANDLLDQLVGFQTSKELHSTTENSSTSMPFWIRVSEIIESFKLLTCVKELLQYFWQILEFEKNVHAYYSNYLI